MNRKILMSGMSIMASLAMLGGSAFAAFTTQAIASGSTFSTGTDSLLVSKDNVDADFAQTITSPFIGAKFTPGTTKTYTFFLKNDATNSNDNLDVVANFTGGTVNPVLDPVLTAQFTCVDPANGTTAAGTFSVQAMRAGQVSLGTINSGEVATCTLTVNLPLTADNTVANQTASFDVNFNATGSVPTPTPTGTQ